MNKVTFILLLIIPFIHATLDVTWTDKHYFPENIDNNTRIGTFRLIDSDHNPYFYMESLTSMFYLKRLNTTQDLYYDVYYVGTSNINYETQQEFDIMVRVSDDEFTRIFKKMISVTDVNEMVHVEEIHLAIHITSNFTPINLESYIGSDPDNDILYYYISTNSNPILFDMFSIKNRTMLDINKFPKDIYLNSTLYINVTDNHINSILSINVSIDTANSSAVASKHNNNQLIYPIVGGLIPLVAIITLVYLLRKKRSISPYNSMHNATLNPLYTEPLEPSVSYI